MKVYSDIRNAYKEYLTYIQENPRVKLPEHVHDPTLSIGKVHASALGRCPKATALKRKIKVDMDLSTLHLMQQGIRDAEPLQEAMYWYYPIETQVEYSVEREYFRGRIDILYGEHIIEIKRRDGYMKNPPQPKLTDVYQLIAYRYMTGLPSINLCLMTRFDLFFWQLVEDGNGFKLINENGEEWRNGYNNPSYLNYSVIVYEGQKHLQYLNEERSDDPMPNFLNIPGGSECFHWESQERPKKYKTSHNGETERSANICPHCPFFGPCKGIAVPANGLLQVGETQYDSKDYYLCPV